MTSTAAGFAYTAALDTDIGDALIAEINTTPLVDVMLVLLIIFMVAIPAATVSIKLDLPPAIPPPPGTKVKEPVLVNIQQGGGIFIGEQATSLDSLTKDLSTVLTKDDPTLPPTEIARKFSLERHTAARQLDLIIFLDGHAHRDQAIEADEAAFVSTLERPGMTWFSSMD